MSICKSSAVNPPGEGISQICAEYALVGSMKNEVEIITLFRVFVGISMFGDMIENELMLSPVS